uniref:Integrase catalytic domain-containing protein n=1 Tax=Plectus sambesii TaxID=2011161 RepID=A0A914WD87_9BILA
MPALQWLDPDFVKQLFENQTCSSIEEARVFICESYPEQKEFTFRTLQRFLNEHGIKVQQRLSKDELESQVRQATEEVGGSLGRKTMQGYLRSKGVQAKQSRISAAQAVVSPPYMENRRRDTQNQLNPQPYRALHFGYNLHMDQNEKCVEYGIVFVIAVDGKSSLIVRGSVMPRKNNITIYKHVYAAATREFGLWDKVVADGGREFYLCEFVQQYLKGFRIKEDGHLSGRLSYVQTTSCKNNRVERLWQEVNKAVGLPIKHAFLELEHTSTTWSRQDQGHLFATSFVGCCVARVLLQRCIDGWNNHSIEDKGIPSQYIASKKNYHLPAGALPSADAAVALYQGEGGQLTEEWQYGVDPLNDQLEKQREREAKFMSALNDSIGGIEGLANHTVNHNYQPIQDAVLLFIEIGVSLS